MSRTATDSISQTPIYFTVKFSEFSHPKLFFDPIGAKIDLGSSALTPRKATEICSETTRVSTSKEKIAIANKGTEWKSPKKCAEN
ncbi:MAG: hypothetical protein ACP5D7_24135 [Limnospira sp.]